LSQKANLKHIILSEPVLSLFIFSLLYPCISLNFLYVSFSPGQGLVEHIFVISYGIMVGNYEKKKEVTLDEKMGKVVKGKKKKRKRKRKKKLFLYVLKILC